MILTYPLVLSSTRAALSTQKESRTTSQIIRDTIKKEGYYGLYAGLSPSLLGISVTNFVYYYFYEGGRTAILKSRQGFKGLSTNESLLNGWIAGSATAIISNPLWVVQTRQTAKTDPNSFAPIPETSPEALKKLPVLEAGHLIVRKEGIGALWAGVGSALILVANPVLQYAAFEQLRNLVVVRRTAKLRAAGSPLAATLSDIDYFLLGALSKLIATSITYPFLVVKNRLQAKSADYPSAMAGLRSIIKNEGMSGLYKGIITKLLQSVLTAAILFASQRRIYEITKKALVTARLVQA